MNILHNKRRDQKGEREREDGGREKGKIKKKRVGGGGKE